MVHAHADRDQLEQLLSDLYRRDAGPQESAPIVLIVNAHAHDVVSDLATWLGTARPHPVPHVVVDLQVPDQQDREPAARHARPSGSEDSAVVQIKDRLRRLAERMGTAAGGSYGFPHLDLVTALMAVQLTELRPRRRRELRAAIHQRSSINAETVNTGQALLDTANPLLRLLLLLPPLWIWLRSSGRMPFLGGVPFRWLLTQSHIVRDDQDRSFLGVAERLTDRFWQHEAPDQVAQVLVDAFLADLRHAFRRRWFRRYRTTRPIVMLRNATGANGGEALLRTVNEVRNTTGRDDPLVLWSESTDVPAFATGPDRRDDEEGLDPLARLEAWRGSSQRRRRRRDDRTWYLIVPAAPTDGDPVGRPPPERPRVPWVRSRSAAALLAVGLLLLPALAYAEHSVTHCGNGLTWMGSAPTTQYRWDTDECIGVSEDLFDFVADDPASHEIFRPVRDALEERNRRSVDVARTSGRRLVTIAYLAALNPDLPGRTLSAEREELAGIVVAQERQLELPDPHEPLLRVLIANGGAGMGHGATTAALLQDAARADPTFVGVVGLNESRQNSVDMLRDLAGYGIPTVAAPLSADQLADGNRLYFQIAPQNRRQAAVLAARIADLAVRREPGAPMTSRIYTNTDETDVYAQNLADDLAEGLRGRGLQSEIVKRSDWYEAGRDACAERGFVLYAGRPVPEFQSFLEGVSSSCPGDPPAIFAGDDVSRYVADTAARTGNAVPFTYVSFAVLPGSHADEEAVTPSARNFFTSYTRLFHPGGPPEDASQDGHAALTYDAVSTVIAGVRNLTGSPVPVPVAPLSLWHSISEIRGDQAIQGASGTIDFAGSTTGGVTARKLVYLVEVDRGEVDRESIEFCGLRSGDTEAGWCPP